MHSCNLSLQKEEAEKEVPGQSWLMVGLAPNDGKTKIRQAWWYTPLTPDFKRQKDRRTLVRSRQVRAIQ